MSTAINPLTSATNPAQPAQTPSGTDPLANESTFLTLLVSQLKNQDPLSPTDTNQFVSQLTAYSQLEQLIGIHNNTTTLATPVAGTTSTGTTSTGTTNSTTGTGN